MILIHLLLSLSSRSYVVGVATDTVQIGSGGVVSIIDRDSVYCEEDVYQLIRVTPAGGSLDVQQLNGANIGNITTFAPNGNGEIFLNPFMLHQAETSNTDYLLTYTFGAVGCSSDDTLTITIPEPANPNFGSVTGNTEYCISEPADSLVGTVSGGTFLVNGFAAFNNRFNPSFQGVGPHIVQHNIANSFGCFSNAIDTFIVNDLPTLSWNNPLNPAYCEDAASFSFEAQPAGGTLTMEIRSGGTPNISTVPNPFLFDPSTIATDSIPDSILFTYTFTDANGCSNTLTGMTVINPLPESKFLGIRTSILCWRTFDRFKSNTKWWCI